MSWFALAVRLGGFALLMPLVLANFKDAEVSVWLLFSAIASFQVVADFGFGPTFSREIAYGFAGRSLVQLHDTEKGQSAIREDAAAHPNWDSIASATAAMLWLYRRIALAAFFLLAVFGTWAAVVPIERTIQPEASWIAWGAVVFTTAASIYGNAYTSFLMGANRIELQKRWEAVVAGFSLLAQTGAVVSGFGLLGLVLVAQTGLVVQVFVNRFLAFRVSEGRFGNAGRSELNRLVMRSMWPVAWRTAIGTIMSLGISQGMAIAMANHLVAAEAASVQLALRVMQIISQFSQVPYYTRIPEFNRLRAGAQTARLSSAAAGAMRISLWIYIAGAIMVDLGIRPFLKLIGSHTQFPDNSFWLVLLVAVFVERYGAMHVQLLLTSNKAIAHVANGVTGIIWVIGLLILFPKVGEIALPYSMLIAYAGFYAWYSAMLSHRSLSNSNFWIFELRTSIIPMGIALGYAVVATYHPFIIQELINKMS